MSRSSSNYSNAERRFREEMAENYSDDEYDLPGDEYEFDGEQGRILNLDHITLPEEIRLRGTMSGHNNLNDYQYRERVEQGRDMERYGSQNNGQYNMENFIVQVLPETKFNFFLFLPETKFNLTLLNVDIPFNGVTSPKNTE